jgi:hypothetical protein
MPRLPTMKDARHPKGSSRVHGWPQYERAERQARLFGAMLDRLGTTDDARQGGLEAVVAASTRCLVCRQADACQQWLAAGNGTQAPDFCAGAGVFGRRRDDEPVV